MKRFVILFLLISFISCDSTPEFSFEEGLKNINDTKLYFKVIGDGEPLLVIHGGPGLSHDYLFEGLKPLAQNFKVIFYDQRASGRSDMTLDIEDDI